MWSQAVTLAMRARAAAAQPFLDVSYTQLADAPLPTLETLYSGLGAELTPAARQQITGRIRTSPAGPRAHHHSAHRYSADRYGLTAEAIRDAFPGP